MKTYTEIEVDKIIRNVIVCVLKGYEEWLESDNVEIVYTGTMEKADGVELGVGKEDFKSHEEFIFPLLNKIGITITKNEI